MRRRTRECKIGKGDRVTKRDLTPTEQAAMRLWEAASSRKPCAPVRDLIGSDNIASAYAVQELNIAKRVRAGACPVGRKIGMTSAAVQKQLGYSEPNYGTPFAGMVSRLNGFPRQPTSRVTLACPRRGCYRATPEGSGYCPQRCIGSDRATLNGRLV